jgi:hypothetical protein
MNSRNHIMFVGVWFYVYFAGIDLSWNMITIQLRIASETRKTSDVKIRLSIEHITRSRSCFLYTWYYSEFSFGGQCKTLTESNKLIWSSDVSTTNVQEFNIEEDSTTGLMTGYIG